MGELGEELVDKAETGVVVEIELFVQTFGGFFSHIGVIRSGAYELEGNQPTIAAFQAQIALAQTEKIDLLLLGFDLLAGGIDILQQRNVAFYKCACSTGIDLLQLLGNPRSLHLIAPDEVYSRFNCIPYKFPGGCLSDAAGTANFSQKGRRVSKMPYGGSVCRCS